jgi:hypothetical protein
MDKIDKYERSSINSTLIRNDATLLKSPPNNDANNVAKNND